MFRHIPVFTVGLVGIANLNAGQIFIGGNTGLTSSVGIATTGGAVENSYISTTFQGTGVTAAETGSGVLCAGATTSTCVPTTGLPSGEPNDEFASANGVTFAMVNESIASVPMGVWAAPNSGTSTITIPIGIIGVTTVDTMLNDEYGVSGATPTTVQFNFGNATSLTFTLINGTVIADSFDCLTGTCPSYATTLDTTHAYSTTGVNLGAIGSTSAPNVSAFTVWSGTYGQGTGAYNNTTGDIFMDAQSFYLGAAAANTSLVNIVITDTAGSATKVSRDVLSAITVVTPEPSTVLLFATGFGAIGFLRRRRKQQ